MRNSSLIVVGIISKDQNWLQEAILDGNQAREILHNQQGLLINETMEERIAVVKGLDNEQSLFFNSTRTTDCPPQNSHFTTKTSIFIIYTKDDFLTSHLHTTHIQIIISPLLIYIDVLDFLK